MKPQFEHLMPLYKARKCYQPQKVKQTRDEQDMYFAQFVLQNPQYDWVQDQACHVTAQEDYATMMRSLRKMDHPTMFDLDGDEDFHLAIEYTKRMLKNLHGSVISNTVEFSKETSAGKPYLSMGLKTKAEAMKSDQFFQDFPLHYHPVFHVTTKTEFLSEQEVYEDHKARTFFIPPVDFVLKQKIVYDDMDSKMKSQNSNFSTFWSRYGFTRQRGGTDRLGRAHADHGHEHEMGDVTGWDRNFPLIRAVYQVRESFLSYTEKQQGLVDHVREGLTHQCFILPNGEVYYKDTGNPSGSGKTTTDNTIGHIIIRFYLWIKAFRLMHWSVDYENILTHVLESLYGDDYLSSVSKQLAKVRSEIWTRSEWLEFVVSIYNKFNGMTIKPSAFAMSNDIQDMEFLGQKFYYNAGKCAYLGEPRWSKAISSLTKIIESKDLFVLASCLVALYFNASSGSKKSLEVKQFLADYCKFLLSHQDIQEIPENVQSVLDKIARGVLDTDSLMLGREGVAQICDIDLESYFN